MSPILVPLLALVAGVVSFSSPCRLPFQPGYDSFISALSTSAFDTKQARARTRRASLCLVAGFALVFTTLGVASAFSGSFVLHFLPTIVRIMRVGVMVLGLSMLGLFRIPFLMGKRRFDIARLLRGPQAAFGVGIAFVAGWTPCVRPILAVILATAASTGTVAWGALLLLLYSVGLGLPFIVLVLGLNRERGSIGWLRRHGRQIEVTGGALTVGVGSCL
jgi:cytochrome c-type biogenesis protein